MTAEFLARVRAMRPLIHCITNPISINQCANAVLAVGARPIMAEHPAEAAEITAGAQALMLNLGNITDARLDSIERSARAAKEAGIPFVLDVVGVSCSQLRRRFARKILDMAQPAVIKGNYSEINALYHDGYRTAGVDAEGALAPAAIAKTAGALARQYNAVVLASGEIDLVTDGKRLFSVKNGTPQLATVTGTGCMQGALCGCYLPVLPSLPATVAACAVLGICGQLAETEKGAGSFMVNLLDRLSTLTEQDFETYLKLEETELESI